MRVAGVFDEPFADPAAIPNYLIAEAAREHVKVALTGDGGDELFAGYWRHAREQTERRLRRASDRWRRRSFPPGAPGWPRQSRRAGLARLGMPISRRMRGSTAASFSTLPLKPASTTQGLRRACRQFRSVCALPRLLRSLLGQRSREQGAVCRFQDVTRRWHSREGGSDEHGARPGDPVAAARSGSRRVRRARASGIEAAPRPWQAPARSGSRRPTAARPSSIGPSTG